MLSEIGDVIKGRQYYKKNNLLLKEAIESSNIIEAIVAEENRIEWSTAVTQNIQGKVAKEKEKYRNWAKQAGTDLYKKFSPLSKEKRSERAWWEYDVYDNYAMRKAIEGLEAKQDLAGMRILDIGGSVKDSWRFVWHGNPRSVDHVEVSPDTQSLAFHKLNILFENDPEAIKKFRFHTTPAENMPFSQSVFDFVFSRATIHHTKRPDAFDEIIRVLKPGGYFLMIEPRLPELVHFLMRLRRKLRRIDRGSDNPLMPKELRALSTKLDIIALNSYTFLTPIITFFFPSIGRKYARQIMALDDHICKTYFGNKLGKNIIFLAQKPFLTVNTA